MVAAAHADPRPPVLSARGIVKRFAGVTALSGVDLDVYPGQVHGLIGENGAGKSTLMHILAGAQRADGGVIRLDGQPVEFTGPRDALDRGISIVYQELKLVPYLTVAENIFLGREILTPLGLVHTRAQEQAARELLAPLDPTIQPGEEVARLRVGQQQIVEIAKALNARARVIFLDEPTSAITDQEVDVLFRLIASLRDQGIALVYVSHKLDELFRITDSITVLRDGALVETLPTASADREGIVRRMVGRELVSLFTTPEKAPPPTGDEPPPNQPPSLEVREITLPDPTASRLVVDHVSLALAPGEVLGIFGLMGAGRTELLECIYGLHPRTATGAVLVDGRPRQIRSPQDALAAGMGLVPEDRKQQGLVLLMSVAHNVSLASLRTAVRSGLVSNRREQTLVGRYAKRLAIKSAGTATAVRNLSGGNQQKVVLAKVLATNPRVLMLDEPTRGIDVGAKAEIYHLIHELKSEGMAILMVSSELPELLANVDRTLVMCEGRVTGEFTRARATEELLMKAAVPGAPVHA